MELSSLGIEFAVSIVLFGAGGWWLDGRLGIRESFPACLIVGVLLGFAYGTWRVLRAFRPPPAPPRDEP